MINLEETFIRGVGLTELPRGARRQLLAKVTDELRPASAHDLRSG